MWSIRACYRTGMELFFAKLFGIYFIIIGAIILGMMALHSSLERRHQAGT